MHPFSAWPVRFSLVGVAGFALGTLLLGDGLPYAGGCDLAATAFPQSTLHAQGDDRGSGRCLCPNFSPVAAYRGSGRITSGSQSDTLSSLVAAYRGSGRITPRSQSDTLSSLVAAYRGSGRITPMPSLASQSLDVAMAYRGSGRVQPNGDRA